MEIIEFREKPHIEPNRLESAPSKVDDIDGPPCWYCGVAEATAWWLGTLIVHIVGGISVFIAFIVFKWFLTGKQPANLEDPHVLLIVTAGEMTLFVFATVLAISLRYWGRTFRELNFSRPDPKHIWIVIGGTLPLTFWVSAWSMPIQFGWYYVCESFPVLKFFDGMNAMTMVKEMAQATPLPLMILIVAVLPAIGEELVFRGAIGRALISHLGVWTGVLITSVLFGLIHIHPVHALSVIPMGIALHLVYLWSRSFWLPMLLHFLNNCWASIAARWEMVDPVGSGMNPTLLEGLEVLTGAVALVALGFALWQSRIRFFLADGQEWNSARFPVRVPPPLGLHRDSAPVNTVCWRLAVTCAIVCHIAVALDLMVSAINAN